MLHFPGPTISCAKTLHTNILIYQCLALQQVIRSKFCESYNWHFFPSESFKYDLLVIWNGYLLMCILFRGHWI